jgi:hypothetical protein
VNELRRQVELRPAFIPFNLGLSGLEKRRDARVVDGGRETGLAEESVAHLFIARSLGPDQLDRDLAIEHLVARTVDHPHSTRTEPTEDLEVGDPLGGFLPAAAVTS